MKITGTIARILQRDLSGNWMNHKVEVLGDDGHRYIVRGRFPLVSSGMRVALEVTPSDGLYILNSFQFDIQYDVMRVLQFVIDSDIVELRGRKSKVKEEAIKVMNEMGFPKFVRSVDEMEPIIVNLEILKPEERMEIISFLRENTILTNLLRILGDTVQYNDLLNLAHRINELGLGTLMDMSAYNLIYIEPSVRFDLVDSYALTNQGFHKTSPLRAAAFVFSQMYNYSATYKVLAVDRERLIQAGARKINVAPGPIRNGIDNLIAKGLVVETSLGYMLRIAYEGITKIANFVRTKAAQPNTLSVDQIAMINAYLSNTNTNLTEEQLKAVENSLFNQISVITGGAGTGKSTVVKTIYDIASKLGFKVGVYAPTGKAADRLSELGAKTIHFAMAWDGMHPHRKLEDDVIIIDEAGMLDLQTFACVVDAISNTNTKLILVGDPYQLPPVGIGNVFADIISSNLVTVSKLSKVFRQGSGESGILDVAYSVLSRNSAKFIDALTKSGIIRANRSIRLDEIISKPGSVHFVEVPSEEYIKSVTVSLIEQLERKQADYICLLPVRNARVGNLNADSLNSRIENMLSQDPFHKSRVICLENDYSYDVYNGMIGRQTNSDVTTRTVTFFAGNQMIPKVFKVYDYERMFSLAYSLTVHKAQGSEYDYVIIPVSVEHKQFWTPKLLYTAVTRARKKLIFVGTHMTLQILDPATLIYDRKVDNILFKALNNELVPVERSRLLVTDDADMIPPYDMIYSVQ